MTNKTANVQSFRQQSKAFDLRSSLPARNPLEKHGHSRHPAAGCPSNTPAELRDEAAAYRLNNREWRELVAGLPADVRRQIGKMQSAGKERLLFIDLLRSWQHTVSQVCRFLHTLTLDALLNGVQAASKQTQKFLWLEDMLSWYLVSLDAQSSSTCNPFPRPLL